MPNDPTLNFRPDQNTANADKRKIAREVHKHGSRRADTPHDKPNKATKPNKGNNAQDIMRDWLWKTNAFSMPLNSLAIGSDYLLGGYGTYRLLQILCKPLSKDRSFSSWVTQGDCTDSGQIKIENQGLHHLQYTCGAANNPSALGCFSR